VRRASPLEEGPCAEVLESVDFAVDPEPATPEFHALRGNIFRVLERWPDAVDAYWTPLRISDDHISNDQRVRTNLNLTEHLVERCRRGGWGDRARGFV
jgi:hypothetical protein